MNSERLELAAGNLGRALDRLEEALALPGEGPMIDASIQRFEFTFELLWKTLKRGLEEAGLRPAGSPRDVLSFAWRSDWLDGDERLWLDMLADRNRTSHLYSEAMAVEVYEHIRVYAPKIRRAHDDLCRRFGFPDGSTGTSEAREKGPRYRKTRKPAGKTTRARATTTTTTTTRGGKRCTAMGRKPRGA